MSNLLSILSIAISLGVLVDILVSRRRKAKGGSGTTTTTIILPPGISPDQVVITVEGHGGPGNTT